MSDITPLQRVEGERDAALVLLCDIDSYFDFGTEWQNGDLGIEDASGVNELWERCRSFLAFMPDDIAARITAMRIERDRTAS